MQHSTALLDALGDAQGIGLLGARPIAEVVTHADAFVEALAEVEGSVLDLGSGGGVPGLVIADVRPDLRLVLLDRRSKRTDFLERVVRRLGWADRVAVVCADATEFARHPDQSHAYSAVVSRGFGPPTHTLSTSRAFVRPGGIIALTEPPAEFGDRWTAEPSGLIRLSPSGHPLAVFRA